MQILWDHTFGKQDTQDLVICKPMAFVHHDEEDEALLATAELAESASYESSGDGSESNTNRNVPPVWMVESSMEPPPPARASPFQLMDLTVRLSGPVPRATTCTVRAGRAAPCGMYIAIRRVNKKRTRTINSKVSTRLLILKNDGCKK